MVILKEGDFSHNRIFGKVLGMFLVVTTGGVGVLLASSDLEARGAAKTLQCRG